MENIVEEDNLGSELEHLVRDTVNPHGKMDTAAGKSRGHQEQRSRHGQFNTIHRRGRDG